MIVKPTSSLSIAIVCYRSGQKELESLLASIKIAVATLKQNVRLSQVTVTLVDNSETSPITSSELHRYKNKLMGASITLGLKQGHGNVGYGRAHNLVLQSAISDFHLILNPDVILDVLSLTKGVEFLLKNPATVLVSPKCNDFEGSRQYLCKRYPSVLTLLIRGLFPRILRRHFQSRLDSYEMRELDSVEDCSEKLGSIEIISGCFMLCRTDALKQVGGFDSRYFLYFEDFDLSLRMSKLGQIAYVPSIKIVHGGGNAAKKGWRHILMFIRSGVKFYNTHGWCWIKQ